MGATCCKHDNVSTEEAVAKPPSRHSIRQPYMQL